MEENVEEKMAPIVAGDSPEIAQTEEVRNDELLGFLASSAKNPWLCPNGHLMGLIVRKKAEGGGNISRLYVLRLAYHPNQVVPENHIFAVIDSGTVGCSICGAHREWRPGNDFVERLGRRHRH